MRRERCPNRAERASWSSASARGQDARRRAAVVPGHLCPACASGRRQNPSRTVPCDSLAIGDASRWEMRKTAPDHGRASGQLLSRAGRAEQPREEPAHCWASLAGLCLALAMVAFHLCLLLSPSLQESPQRNAGSRTAYHFQAPARQELARRYALSSLCACCPI